MNNYSDSRNIASFLTLGYFLDYSNPHFNINTFCIDKKKYKNIDEGTLIKTGSKLWFNAISETFDINKEHVVPLSGGLDSRAILAGLLEHTEAGNIRTYTFGIPGALDYEIGNYVAKKCGTKHIKFNLNNHVYRQDELEDISKRVRQQTILFHHCPVWDADKLYKGCVVWSGFMGDPLAGSHLQTEPSKSLEEAKKIFIKKNRYVKSIELKKETTGFSDLINCELIDLNLLTLDEQLDFQNRQIKYIVPHVLMEGYAYKTPFLYQPWIDFILSVDNKHRHKMALYKKILLRSFPKIFSYRTKTCKGLPLNPSRYQIFVEKVQNKIERFTGIDAKYKYINYMDFNRSIREKPDLKDIFISNITDLYKRDIIDWIDINKILKDHIENRGNYADALITLCSLEIHLKTGKRL